MVFSLVGCQSGETNTNIDNVISECANNADSADNNTSKYEIDYLDAESFESALNDGAKVKGKIVQFDVVEYKPDSAMGINCWSGKHLNFISENELDVKKGDIIVGRVSREPTQTFGSWKISYKVLEINSKAVNIENTSSTNQEDDKSSKITMTMSEDELKGLVTADAEKKLKEMGFTIFEYQILETHDRTKADKSVESVAIKTSVSETNNFSKGDTYEPNATVVIRYYKLKEESISSIQESTVTSTTPDISSVQPSKNSSKYEIMVWIPETGSKYHSKSGCSGMKNPRQVTVSEAERMGYTPCKRCH